MRVKARLPTSTKALVAMSSSLTPMPTMQHMMMLARVLVWPAGTHNKATQTKPVAHHTPTHSAYMMMDYRHTDELDTTMLAPASRGKHVPLLGSSIRPRRGQRRRIHSAWCCVGLVAIALLGLGCIIGISALLANHSPAPPGLTGLQGYTAQVPTRAAFDAYVAFLNNTLSLDNVVTCSDASSPVLHTAVVPPTHHSLTPLPLHTCRTTTL